MTFEQRLGHVASTMEDVLARVLPKPEGRQKIVMEAMRYASLQGGKRLRPFLLVEAARLMGGAQEPGDGIWLAAAALECVHVYSLIHDDLPCMDDDDMRRGRPSVHKAYGEAIAVLAGDGLLSFAFEILAQDALHEDSALRLRLVGELARSSGVRGMIGGQVIDIQMDNTPVDENTVRQLQALKTGALINYAVLSGGRLAGAAAADLANLEGYANALGLIYQISDDILDADGDAHQVGKAVGKDAGLGKATFVSLYGLDGAKSKAFTLGEQAKSALSGYGEKAETLKQAVDFILSRKK